MISRSFFFLILISFICIKASAQKQESPYETSFIKDGLYTTGTIGLNVLGLFLVQNKDNLSVQELRDLNKNDIWKIDRFAAGNYSSQANEDSYIPMYGSFATPFLLLLGKETRSNAGQISVLFIETMATTGALFTLSAGLIEKPRPLVYNEDLPEEDRIANDEQRSFFAGHTASSAAATFFAAKVFNDFYPDSPYKPLVWGIAAAIPATVGYLRIQSGKHFLTDNIIGYAVGAASGILIPEIHKKTSKNIDIYPTATGYPGSINMTAQGLGFSYTFN